MCLRRTCLGIGGKPNVVSSPYLKNSVETSPHSNNCGFFELRRKLSQENDESPERLNVYVALRVSFPHVGMNYSTCCGYNR